MYFKSIQLVRAFAAVYITLYHTIYWWNQKDGLLKGIFDNGYGSVDLFFVVSGFVVFHSANKLSNELDSFLYFLARRIIRIYPMYWIIAIVVILFNQLQIREHPFELLKSFLLWPGSFPIILTTWTLSYELYFYILIGLAILNSRFRLIIAGIFFLSIISFSAIFMKGIATAIPVKGYYNEFVLEFFLGVLCTYVFKNVSLRTSLILTIAGLVLFLFPIKQVSSNIISFGLPSAFLIIGLAAMEYRGKIRIPRFFALIGDSSYCLYLIHLPVISYLFPYPAGSQPINRLMILTVVFLITLVSILTHLYIEKPLLASANRYLLRFKPPIITKKI